MYADADEIERAVELRGADARRKENWHVKPLRARVACELARQGLGVGEVADALGASPAFIAMALPHHLCHATEGERGIRIAAVAVGADPDYWVACRGAERKQDRLIARDERQAWAEYRLRERVERRRERERARIQQQAERRRQRERRTVTAWCSLDAPLPGADWATLGDVVPARPVSDPAVLLCGDDHIAGEILGDLELADVARMDEHQLGHLRDRLREAGVAPRNVQERERGRLRGAAPHRGDGGPSPRMGKKSGRARGGKERSAAHKARGKRFNRRKDRYRQQAA